MITTLNTTVARVTDRRLRFVTEGHEVWTSLEGENPGGSIKDRMVYAELSRAIKNEELKPGARVSEISAGSTALSLAYYARAFGFSCSLFVPNDLDAELRSSLLRLGAELHSRAPEGAYAAYDEFCQTRPVWRLDQMKRTELREHYKSWAETELCGNFPQPDYVIGSIGTGHSLIGVSTALHPVMGAVTAEPDNKRLIHGIRNLALESFGGDDPCPASAFAMRIELEKRQFFSDLRVETDQGLIVTSDSFRVVLGAVEKLTESLIKPLASESRRLRIFTVGSQNRRA